MPEHLEIASQLIPPVSPKIDANLDREKLRLDRQEHQLEVLKTLHSAGLERWKNRRENEWKLNYAIWAGIAGLDGILLLHKEAVHLNRGEVWSCTGIALLFHTAYLWPTIERAISEIEMQKELELAIRSLVKSRKIRELIKTDNLGGAIDRYDHLGPVRKWLWKRYGLFAPLALTAGLMALAGILMRRP